MVPPLPRDNVARRHKTGVAYALLGALAFACMAVALSLNRDDTSSFRSEVPLLGTELAPHGARPYYQNVLLDWFIGGGIEDRVSAMLGARYGDIWFDVLNGRDVVVVGVKNATLEDLAHIRRLAPAHARSVVVGVLRFSLAEMTTFYDRVCAYLERPDVSRRFRSMSCGQGKDKIDVTLSHPDREVESGLRAIVPEGVIALDYGVILPAGSADNRPPAPR